MGRIRQYIDVGNQKHWALFDSGARNTYVTKEVAANLPRFQLSKPNPVALGGKIHHVNEDCRLVCKIKGYEIRANVLVLDSI